MKIVIGHVGETIAGIGGVAMIVMCATNNVVLPWIGVACVVVGGVLIDVDLMLNLHKEKD